MGHLRVGRGRVCHRPFTLTYICMYMSVRKRMCECIYVNVYVYTCVCTGTHDMHTIHSTLTNICNASTYSTTPPAVGTHNVHTYIRTYVCTVPGY